MKPSKRVIKKALEKGVWLNGNFTTEFYVSLHYDRQRKVYYFEFMDWECDRYRLELEDYKKKWALRKEDLK